MLEKKGGKLKTENFFSSIKHIVPKTMRDRMYSTQGQDEKEDN